MGTRANRTIAKQIQSVIAVKRIDALGLDLTTVIDTKVLTTAFLAADPQFSIDEIRERSKSIKFADCLPDSFLARVILLRQFEQPASTS